MKRIFKIITLFLGLFFISVISFNCKEYNIRIWGIEMNAYGLLYEKHNVYSRETGLSLTIDTKYDDIASLYLPSSSCYAFYDPGIFVENPIDTNTINFFCNGGIIINQDTILPRTNLYKEEICRKHLHIYEDSYGGYLFSFITDDNFFVENMKFLYKDDSLFTFIFNAETIDNIFLSDSVNVKINWY